VYPSFCTERPRVVVRLCFVVLVTGLDDPVLYFGVIVTRLGDMRQTKIFGQG